MRHKRISRASAAVMIGAALACSAPVFAQGRRSQSTPPGYDLKAEVTLVVTVTEVKRIEGGAGQGGVHLIVKSGAGSLEVDLGPQWFLTERKYSFAAKDELTVTGARTKRNDVDALIAREIKRGDQTMTFRDAKGFPLWAGRGGGSPD